MSKETTKISYGRPMLKKLVDHANNLGIQVSFYINQEGKYVLTDREKTRVPPTAACACHYVMGMISAAKTRR